MIQFIFEAELELDSLDESFELTTELDDEYIIQEINEDKIDLLLELTSDEEYIIDINDSNILDFIVESSSAIINYIEGDVYDGSYSVTPSQQPQILPTENRILVENITVGAIPSNYGLIEWNGAIMRIS